MDEKLPSHPGGGAGSPGAETNGTSEDRLRRFVSDWIRASVEKDVEAASRLRDPSYVAVFPGGGALSREEELALIASDEFAPAPASPERLELAIADGGTRATARFIVDTDAGPEAQAARYACTLELRSEGDGWLATRASVEACDPRGRGRSFEKVRGAVSDTVRRSVSGVKRRLDRLARADFQTLAYRPYRPGRDFLLPPLPQAAAGPSELPIPPQSLWLGYNYPAHGRIHVDAMLRIVEASGFVFEPGDRILDLGCGAGRMIRHLQHLAATCEIWGTDISAEHILWCKRHLSPPFRFATTTKVPSLPFEDRSFALIYCGSLFTHIDDLADAWLLELHRILAPGGRLYVTIHDQHTMALMEQPKYGWSGIVRGMKSNPLFARAKSGFSMFSLGRDDESQVFYERGCFEAMASSAFDVLAVEEEAYFYQTALLLARKRGPPSAAGRRR